MKTRKNIAISAVVILLLALLVFVGYVARSMANNNNTASSSTKDALVNNTPVQPLSNQSTMGGMQSVADMQVADTYKDIQIDGDIIATATGDVMINEQLRNLYDYINTAYAAYPQSKRIAWLSQFMDKKNLNSSKKTYLLGLYQRYSQYSIAVLAYIQQHKDTSTNTDLNKVKAIKQQTYELQAQYFNATEIMGFFGFEKEYDTYQINTAEIMNDTSLSAAQKASALATEREKVPAQIKESIMQTHVVEELADLTALNKAKGGSAADLRAIRTQLVGAEATTRLEQMDAEDAAWMQRITRYKADKAVIEANVQLSNLQKEAEINALQNTRFGSEEKLRLKAYD